MTNGIPLYERTINKNAVKRSAKEERDCMRNGVVAGRAAINDSFHAIHARTALPPLHKLLNLSQREILDILQGVDFKRRRLNTAERRRLRLLEVQHRRLSEGVSALNTVLGM